MLVVMTCVFPNVSKTLPGIWIKYCADVAAWRDRLTGGNHSRVSVNDMKRKPSSKTEYYSNYNNLMLSTGFLLLSMFLIHKPNQNTSPALNTPISVFGSS